MLTDKKDKGQSDLSVPPHFLQGLVSGGSSHYFGIDRG